MIMQSGRFSGGGGGGSNRDVVFTARVDTKDARKELSAFAKDVESVKKQLGNMRMGAGGAPGLAGGALGVGGVAAGGTRARGMSNYDRQLRDWENEQKRNDREKQAFERRRAAEQRRHDNELRRTREREARADFLAIERENQQYYNRQAAGRRRGFGGAAGADGFKAFNKDAKDAMEGVIGLSRAMVLFGATSEESLDRALRKIMAFEAGVAGYKGGVKLAGGLGGLLGRAAPKLGLAAGGGATALGAAGIAAGVGVLGGGAAIYDQINYSRTGRIGAYSQGYSDIATGLAGSLKGWGIDPRGNPLMGGLMGAAGFGIPNMLAGAGFYDASDSNDRARSGMRGALNAQGNMVQESTKRLAIERDILSIMEREAETIKRASEAAKDRRTSAAMGFASLSPWDQRGVSQLRDRFLKDPGKLSNRELMAVMPYVGANENAQIQDRIRRRMPAEFTNRGFAGESEADFRAAGESGLRPGAVQVQRELVLELTIDNSQAIKDLENLVEKALDGADKQLEAAVAEMEKRLNDFNRQMEQNRQLGIGAQSSAFGSGF